MLSYKMNMNQEINQWLKSLDYQKGIALYQKLGANPTFLAWFIKGYNIAKAAKLQTEIKKFLVEETISTNSPDQVIETLKAGLRTAKGIFAENLSDDPEVIAIVARKNELFRLIPKIKAKFNIMVWEETKYTNQERGQVAKQLSELKRENNEVWTAINHFRAKGELPQPIIKEIKALPTDITELIKKRNTLRSNLTKIKSGKRAKSNLENDTAQLIAIEALIKTHETNHQK